MDGRGSVGENGERGGFRPGQFVGRPAEIPPGGSIQAHDVSPERGVGGVQGQDFILGQTGLQPGGQDGFHPFLPKRPFLSPGHPDYLHRDRTAPAHDMPLVDVAPERPDERQGIHARMPPEMPVFELDEGCGVSLGNGIAGREPPLSVRRDAGPQEFAVAVGDDRRVGRTPEEVPRQAAEPACEKDLEKNQCNGLPAAHRVTEAAPEAVLAATCGLYMAVHVTAGRM